MAGAPMGGMRRPREECENAVHHVYARGVRRQDLFRDDVDRARYLGLLGRAVNHKRWRCLAFCLMSNHMHLLIQTPDPNLGAGMQWFHGRYGTWFNQRHKTSGHVFQGRYQSVRVTSDPQWIATLRYIALNPVEAGLCEDARDWRWSSYALLVEGIAPEWVDGERVRAYLAAWGADLREVA
jgi:putative transposase